jgi:hypothetical protein
MNDNNDWIWAAAYSILSEVSQSVILFKDMPAFLRYNGLFQEIRRARKSHSTYTAHLHAYILHKEFQTIKQEFRFNFLNFPFKFYSK